jgi:hypothetical protein
MKLSSVMSHPPCSEHPSDRLNRFRELGTAYRDFAREAGVELVAFRDPSLPMFSRKNEEEQRDILVALENCVKICRDTRAQGKEMGNSPALIWQALKQFGLRPSSDLFAHITDDSVVEVHSIHGVQLFRNFNFYRFCSYSLEELYCGSWSTLFDRNEAFTDQIMAFVDRVFSGEQRHAERIEIIHVARELYSPLLYEIELSMEWGGPLFEEGTANPLATIVIERFKFTESSLKSAHRLPPSFLAAEDAHL